MARTLLPTRRKTALAKSGEAPARPRASLRRIAPRILLIVAGIAVAGVGFSGQAAAQQRGPVKSMYEMRMEHVVLQKFDISCGAAALATVLTYQFGDRVTEREVALGLISRKEYIENPELLRIRQGFSLLDMKRYVDNRGYGGVGYGQLEFDDLRKLAPAIVAVNPVGYNHFLVFRGVIGDQVLLADPGYGNRTMSIEKFKRVWIEFPDIGRVGFVVERGGKTAPPGLLGVRPGEVVAPSSQQVRQALFF